MTTARQMNESEETFAQWKEVSRPCPMCGAASVQLRVWESSDGAYEDENYSCAAYGYTWWIDGIDS